MKYSNTLAHKPWGSSEALPSSWDRLKAEHWREAAALWWQQRQTTCQHLEPTSKSPEGWGQSLSRPGEPRSLLGLLLLSTAQAFFRESYSLGLAAGSSRLSSSLAITHTHRLPSCPLHLEHSSPTPLYPFSPFPNSEHRSLSEVHISEACLPMSPSLRFYPVFILFHAPASYLALLWTPIPICP